MSDDQVRLGRAIEGFVERERKEGTTYDEFPVKTKDSRNETSQVPTKSGKEELELSMFVHHSSYGTLCINTTTGVVRFKTKKDTSYKSPTFSSDSEIQCFPFKKGRTLCFVNCGYCIKRNVGGVREALMQDKTFHVYLPPGADLVHEEYVKRPDSKQGDAAFFGTYNKVFAQSNELIFEQFLDEFKKVMWSGKVKILEQEMSV